jgi:hypothetical protein
MKTLKRNPALTNQQYKEMTVHGVQSTPNPEPLIQNNQRLHSSAQTDHHMSYTSMLNNVLLNA